MESEYLIQVLHKSTGKVVQWEPGLSVEKALVTELIGRVRTKGVGVFRTENHVIHDVREALEELLYELKSKV